MNISITNECNRRCEYCFQKSWYLADSKENVKEMSVDTLKEVLEWSNGEFNFNILGGEPLLHSQINDILIACRDASRYVSLITNLLVPYEKITYIVENFNNKPIFSWLLNTDYQNIRQERAFLRNILLLKDKNISLSSTLLSNNEDIEKSLHRMCKIIDVVGDECDYTIRLSPTTPNYLLKYNNFDYTDNIINYIDTVWKKRKCNITFDCHVNYCEVNLDKLEEYFKEDFEKYFSFHNDTCDNGAFDILADGSIIWCSSCKHIKLDCYKDYTNVAVCRNELYKQWKLYWKNTKLKCNFKSCEYFNPAKCSGICAGRNYNIENSLFTGV